MRGADGGGWLGWDGEAAEELVSCDGHCVTAAPEERTWSPS